MRAVRYDEFGDVDVLAVVEVDKPEPKLGEVVVAVRAASINPGEAKIRQGALESRWPSTLPQGQGSDLAGVIDAVGEGVDGFEVGEEVLGYTDDRSSQAEYVSVPVDQIVRKPEALSFEQAGGLYVAGVTAYALNDAAKVTDGDVVVVSAAAGGVGSLAAQWATTLGAIVIGLAGPDNHDWVRERGIVPVDYAGDALADRVRDAAGGQVSVLLDTYGPPYVQLGFDLGVHADRIATIADFEAAERGVQIVMGNSVVSPAVLTQLAEALATGKVEMPIAATYPLDRVRDAYRALAGGHTRGKIVLIP